MSGKQIAELNPSLTLSASLVNIFYVLCLHAILFVATWLLATRCSIVVAAPLFVLISLIHIKFLAEFLHEGSHFNFFYQHNWNDFWVNACVGVFLGTSAEKYRNLHFQHHSFQTFFLAEDPETCLLKVHTRSDFYRALLSDLSGLTGLLIFFKYVSSQPKTPAKKGKKSFDWSLLYFGIIHGAGVIAALRFGFFTYYLLYYFTLGTLYPLQLRLKILCQHVKLDFHGDALVSYEVTTSRTIKGGLLEQIFFTSEITAYHELHHRYPHYPYRTLQALHAASAVSADPNVFTTSRTSILRRFYRALA